MPKITAHIKKTPYFDSDERNTALVLDIAYTLFGASCER
jgi:hypothetical protein